MSKSMMKKDPDRIKLKKFCGRKETFTARLIRIGDTKGTKDPIGKKVLLEDIRLQTKSKNNKNNEILCDHVWIERDELLKGTCTIPPPLIQFNAQVIDYIKYGSHNRRILSWKLTNMENIKYLEITEAQRQQIIRRGKRSLLL